MEAELSHQMRSGVLRPIFLTPGSLGELGLTNQPQKKKTCKTLKTNKTAQEHETTEAKRLYLLASRPALVLAWINSDSDMSESPPSLVEPSVWSGRVGFETFFGGSRFDGIMKHGIVDKRKMQKGRRSERAARQRISGQVEEGRAERRRGRKEKGEKMDENQDKHTETRALLVESEEKGT